jgi:hypothetical protein
MRSPPVKLAIENFPNLCYRTSMNTRRQLYKQNRLKGMSKYNAAKAAGYAENTARNVTHKLEKHVKVELNDLFEQAGLTDLKLVQYVKEALEADKPYGTNADILHPDWATRHKFFNTMLQLMGKLESASSSGGKSTVVVVYPQAPNQDQPRETIDVTVRNPS